MSSTDGEFRNREVENIIRDIRGEVATQKECITRYTFQALIVTGALWAFAFKLNAGASPIEIATCGMLSCALVCWVIFIVSRTANHKYHTVNRNLGYELHLSRLKDYHLGREESKKWSAMMLEIGWEEAMCAARVVQATLFNYLYTDQLFPLPKWVDYRALLDLHWLRTYRLKPEHKLKFYSQSELQGKAIYEWYNTHSLIGSDHDYHPGSYLRNIHVTLHTVGFVSIAMIWGFYFWLYQTIQSDPWQLSSIKHIFALKGGYFALFGAFNFVLTVFFFTQVRRQRSFRQILQSEILSIQSAAVVWRIVCTCHILAKECAFYKNKSYMSYTRYTHGFALEARKNFYRIHQWLSEWEDCYNDPALLHRKFDELFPAADEPHYLEYLPGQEPKEHIEGVIVPESQPVLGTMRTAVFKWVIIIVGFAAAAFIWTR